MKLTNLIPLNHRQIALFILILCGLSVIFCFIPSKRLKNASLASSIVSGSSSVSQVLVLNLTGMITAGGSGGGPFGGGEGSATYVRNQLHKAANNNHIKGVLLRINSPGGTVGMSQEIYQEIMDLKQAKPVYASIGDVGASGGYYIASACDRIYANAGSLTGSIGVIMQGINYQKLYQKLGLEDQTFKAGQYKDLGSGTRQMSIEERQIMQRLLDDTYQQFLRDVVAGRQSAHYSDHGKQINLTNLPNLAQGLIYTGRQALKARLIDEIGGYETAIADLKLKAKKKFHLLSDPRVVEMSDTGLSDLLTGLTGQSHMDQSLASRIMQLINSIIPSIPTNASRQSSVASYQPPILVVWAPATNHN